LNPKHNHSASDNPAGHTVNQKLTATLFEEMKQLVEAGLKPSAILEVLKKTHPDKIILATITTIYSARKKAQQQLLQVIIPIVHLNQTLANSDFTTTTKVNEDGKLKGLFFCHT
jgi:ABC-type Fe3+-hydroxamate transport system substrate-binding protein